MSSREVAQLCQRAENNFVGAQCGIMDQFTSCMGQAGRALLLDCRSLEYESVPIPAQIALVICNTMVKHELSGGEYNSRRRECDEGVQLLAAKLPEIRALRDVSISALNKYRDVLPPVVYRRCRHVISENERVHRMVTALRIVDTDSMTALMAESHASLRDDFQVSCLELDIMVEIASRQRGVFGARMMGGGFGGCTINLVDVDGVAEFKNNMSSGYFEATGQKPEIYVCRPSDGAGVVSRSLKAFTPPIA
jgi:galactokinase